MSHYLSNDTNAAFQDEHDISGYYLRGYLHGAVSQGLCPEKLLSKAGIPPEYYHDKKAKVSDQQMLRLLYVLKESLNDMYLGLLRVPGKLAMEDRMSQVAIKSGTLGEGIRELIDFINAVRHDEHRRCKMDSHTGDFHIAFELSDLVQGGDKHLLAFYRMLGAYRLYSWLIGERIHLNRICFASSRKRHFLDYRKLFNCEVLYKQPEDALVFNKSYLTRTIVRAESELQSDTLLKNYPGLFTIPGKDQRLCNQVEQVIGELHRQGFASPSVEMVAEVMSVSVRTLSRKLNKEKTTFQKIKTKVRCEIAKRILVISDIPIAHIATKVGFSEPCDFTRAFIGWTGQTPSRFRESRHGELNSFQLVAENA